MLPDRLLAAQPTDASTAAEVRRRGRLGRDGRRAEPGLASPSATSIGRMATRPGSDRRADPSAVS
jgi:hypothetical protein